MRDPATACCSPRLETLKASIEFDPRGVLIRSGRLMQAAHDGQYDTDSQALSQHDPARYLAEHRELLADVECRTSLLRSLELFVMADWPAARAPRLPFGRGVP